MKPLLETAAAQGGLDKAGQGSTSLSDQLFSQPAGDIDCLHLPGEETLLGFARERTGVPASQ